VIGQTGDVNERRFFNPSQPQTLQIAVILCYLDAVLGILNGLLFWGLGIFIVVGLGAGAYGIANEKKWGYALALAAAIVQVVLFLAAYQFDTFNRVNLLLGFMFDAALVGLLVHPMSRDYQRIWFR
jgi:hypothetical protein